MKNIVLVLILFIFPIVPSALAQSATPLEGLALKYVVQLPVQKLPKPPVVILLHGFGSNESDMFGLRGFFPKNYIVISARAPYNVAGGGYQWFEKEIVNGKYTGKKEDLDFSRNSILKFVGEVVAKYNADAGQVYLVGFSQGAMMSYEAGLVAPETIRGVGVLSGRLPESLKPLIKKSPFLDRLKIFIAHGDADTRLSFTDGKAAYDHLISIGLRPEFHMYPGMEHTISKEVVADLLKWLK